jgi:hypothetical protein
MSSQIQENEKTAFEALRQLYFAGMQASQAWRMAAITSLTETRVAAQVNAREVYAETVRQADADLEAAVGGAKVVCDTGVAPFLAAYERQTEVCKAERIAAEDAANEQYKASRVLIDLAFELAKDMAEEEYVVSHENLADHDSAGYDAITEKFEDAVNAASDARRLAIATADQARKLLLDEGNAKRANVECSAMLEYEAGCKPFHDVFAAINRPAQSTHATIKREAWDTQEASRKEANEAESRAREEIDLRFAAKRRTRVLLWKQMEDELKRFTSVYS